MYYVRGRLFNGMYIHVAMIFFSQYCGVASVAVLLRHLSPTYGHLSPDLWRFMYLSRCSWYLCAPVNADSFQVKFIHFSIWILGHSPDSVKLNREIDTFCMCIAVIC